MRMSSKLAIVFGVIALSGCKTEQKISENSISYKNPVDGTTHTIVYDGEGRQGIGYHSYPDKSTNQEFVIGSGNVILSRDEGDTNWLAMAVKPDGTPYIGTITDSQISINKYSNTLTETDGTRITINKSGSVLIEEPAVLDALGGKTYYDSFVTYKKPDGSVHETEVLGRSVAVREDYIILIDDKYNIINISNSDVFTLKKPLNVSSKDNATEVMFRMPNGELYTGKAEEDVRFFEGTTRWVDTKGTEIKVNESGVVSIRKQGELYCTVMFKDKDDALYVGNSLDVGMDKSGASFTDVTGTKIKVSTDKSITVSSSKTKATEIKPNI